MLETLLTFLIPLTVIVWIYSKLFKVEQDEPANLREMHIKDFYHEPENKLYIVTLYNDEENSNSEDLLFRVWITIKRIHVYKTVENLKMKVTLPGKSIDLDCHDTISLNGISNFEDYWSVVKNSTQVIDNYYDNGVDPNNEFSYNRVFVYLYY